MQSHKSQTIICKTARTHIEFSYHITIMSYFLLICHLKSQLNTLTSVLVTWWRVGKFSPREHSSLWKGGRPLVAQTSSISQDERCWFGRPPQWKTSQGHGTNLKDSQTSERTWRKQAWWSISEQKQWHKTATKVVGKKYNWRHSQDIFYT